MTIPWWVKLCAKLILSRLPLRYAVWQRLGLFRHGCMDASGYAIQVFHSHVEKAGFKDKLPGKTVMEFGPGDSIASAIIAAAHGARAILVDAGCFVETDVVSYFELERVLSENGLNINLSGCRNVDEILEHCNASYMTQGLESLRKIEDSSVDLVFSQAVLEHVRRKDFQETMRECRRILRPGGVCSHRVDLGDHLGGGLNNLRFSEMIWESGFFANSGFYTNRFRYSEMLDLFRQAGFQVRVTGVRRWEALPTQRNKLAKAFSALPDDELCISGFDVLLQ